MDIALGLKNEGIIKILLDHAQSKGNITEEAKEEAKAEPREGEEVSSLAD